jgi:hypothetical protein
LKPVQTGSSQGPILINPSQKRAGGVAHVVGPEVKPQNLYVIMFDFTLSKIFELLKGGVGRTSPNHTKIKQKHFYTVRNKVNTIYTFMI